jgi:hypothetical protein
MESSKDTAENRICIQREYDKEILENRYKSVINRISNLGLKGNKVCIIYGMGKQPKIAYKEIESISGVQVIWYESLFSKWLRPLSYLIASYAGLIKIYDIKVLPEIFNKLSNMAMVGVYIFSNDLEDAFVKKVQTTKSSHYGDLIVKEDLEFFIYKVDTDNIESSTGIYEIVSYGENCPIEIINIL